MEGSCARLRGVDVTGETQSIKMRADDKGLECCEE